MSCVCKVLSFAMCVCVCVCVCTHVHPVLVECVVCVSPSCPPVARGVLVYWRSVLCVCCLLSAHMMVDWQIGCHLVSGTVLHG